MEQIELFEGSLIYESEIRRNKILSLVALLSSEASAKPKIRTPMDTYAYLSPFIAKEQEHFVVLLLNSAQRVIKTHLVTIGLANRVLVHPREIFKEAIRLNAVALIAGHNHPSANLEPSDEDIIMSRRLYEAGELLGINVLDHVIVGTCGYYSFIESRGSMKD